MEVPFRSALTFKCIIELLCRHMWSKINSNPKKRIVECVILCSFMLYWLFLLIRNVNYYKRNLLKTPMNDCVKKENSVLTCEGGKPPMFLDESAS